MRFTTGVASFATPRAVAAGATATALVAAAVGSLVVRDSREGHAAHPRAGGPADHGPAATHRARPAAAAAPPAPARRPRRPFPVGLRTLRLVDRSRSARRPDGRIVPRTLVTVLRYPAVGTAAPTDRRNAPAAVADRPYPLVIFGHGFALLPSTYALLLRAVARAGYVVAAPAFPLERADAPGGAVPDLAGQPGDVRFLITRLLRAAASSRGPLGGLLDPAKIAVGGHSDGGATAEAVAFGRRRDARIRAAVILAGAGTADAATGPGDPALLAIQGTADAVHPPASTYAFYAAAHPPKYLLRLLGEGHESPYTAARPRRVVERVVVAFLDRYLLELPGAARRLSVAGRAARLATLTSAP